MVKLKRICKQLRTYPVRLANKSTSLTALVNNSEISNKARISPFTKFYSSKINDYSYIGWNTIITDSSIGKFSSIAGDCVIGGASHPINWVSTSPVFYSGKNIFDENFSNNHYRDTELTIIKNDVWIAANVIIKQGVTIENGAVVGMGSVVTKSVGPYEIWGGNPAKKLGTRFSNDIIETLNSSDWWDYEEDLIKEIAADFNDVEKVIRKIKEIKNEDSTY